jgi:hypothetical protein
MKDKSRSKDKDYYYKYKALKYFLKNQNLKRGGSSDADTTDNSDKTTDLLSPTTNTNGLQLPDGYQDKFTSEELVAINEGDNDQFLKNIFENMSDELKQNKEFLADLVNRDTNLVNFISEDIKYEEKFINKIDNIAEVYSEENYKNSKKEQLIELIKKDINILSISEVQNRDDYEKIINEVVVNIHPGALLIDPEKIEQKNIFTVLKKYPVLLKAIPQKSDTDFIKKLISSVNENYNQEEINKDLENLKNELEKEEVNLRSLNANRFRYTNDQESFNNLKKEYEEKIENLKTQIEQN